MDNPYYAPIRQMWCEILDREEIAPDDHFFALGGNSLSAMLLISRLEETYDLELDAEELAEYQTLSALADFIREKRAPFDRIARQA